MTVGIAAAGLPVHMTGEVSCDKGQIGGGVTVYLDIKTDEER
jgi:hypothetical protein